MPGQTTEDTPEEGFLGGERLQPALNPTRFSALTGVSRERLRTWERRHGYPQPVRKGGGPRRYLVADVPRVIAIREAIEQGVPVSQAIKAAKESTGSDTSDLREELIGPLGDSLPLPFAILSGPEPLRVEYLNDFAAAGELAVGEDLLATAPQLAGSDAETGLTQLFRGDDRPIECEHPPIFGPSTGSGHSLLFRIARAPGKPAMAGLISLERARERSEREQLAQVEADLETVRDRADQAAGRLEGVGDLARRIRDDDRVGAVLRAGTDQLAEQLGAADAAVAVYMTGELAVGSSSRGQVGPSMVLVSGYKDLGPLLRERKATWLRGPTVKAFGISDGDVFAMPIVAAGDIVAALLLVFSERREMDPDERRLVDIVTSMIGIALLRDRFAEGVSREETEEPG